MIELEKYLDEMRTMPESMPGVVFDVNLGNHLGYIDFDYLSYQAYLLNDLKVDRENIKKLQILFTNSDLGDKPETSGRFLWSDDLPENEDKFTIEIKVPNIRVHNNGSQAVTNTLIHESKHFADYVNNNYPLRMKKIGIIATRYAYKYVPWEASARKAVDDFRSSQLSTNSNIVIFW